MKKLLCAALTALLSLAVVLNDEIIKEIPLDAFSEDFYFEDIKGTFQLVVAGESAAFEFYVEVE